MYEFCADRADETDVNAEATLTAGEAERGSDDDVEREWPCDWVLGSQCSNERPCKDVFESTRNVLRVCIRFSGVNCCWKRLDSTKLFGVWERDADVGGIRYIDDEWFFTKINLMRFGNTNMTRNKCSPHPPGGFLFSTSLTDLAVPYVPSDA